MTVDAVKARSFTYDGLGRLSTALNFNLGLGHSFSPVPANKRSVTNTLAYDALGRISSETTTLGRGVMRTTGSAWAQPAGWRRDVSRPDGTAATETFDTLGRLATMARPWSSRSTTWDFQGAFETRVSSTKSGSPFRKTTSYDGLGQALEWKHTAVDIDGSGNPVVAAEGLVVCPSGWNATCGTAVQTIAVLRDQAGRIGSYTRTVGRPNVAADVTWRGFTYDALGRVASTHEAVTAPTVSAASHTLTSAQVLSLASSASAANWSYARTVGGDLTSITKRRTPSRFVATRAREAGHQLSEYDINGATLTVRHDAAGRVSRNGDQNYVWDGFSSLAQVYTSPDVLVEALQYDGFGRLIARWGASGLQDEFGYDGAQMVAAWDSAGTVKWSATWARGIDSLLSIKNPTGEYLALDDGKANVVGYLRAEDSKLVAQAEYNPEGRAKLTNLETSVTCDETNSSTRCAPLLDLPFGFHGAFESAGSGLVYFRNRWYSNEAGQFLSHDPLGYVDSFNSYAFNKFDPVNFVDPWGLATGDSSGWTPPCTGGACGEGTGSTTTMEEPPKAANNRNPARETQAEATERRQQGHAAQEPKRSKTDEGGATKANPQRQGYVPGPVVRPPIGNQNATPRPHEGLDRGALRDDRAARQRKNWLLEHDIPLMDPRAALPYRMPDGGLLVLPDGGLNPGAVPDPRTQPHAPRPPRPPPVSPSRPGGGRPDAGAPDAGSGSGVQPTNPAKAPGVPTANDGFIPKKGWDGVTTVKNPNGPGRGYQDASGRVWMPTGPGPLAHGGPHWDVQIPGGGYLNVYPGGAVRK